MARLAWVAPPHWDPVRQALERAGHDVWPVTHGSEWAGLLPPALIDVRKGIVAIEAPAEMRRLVDDLPGALMRASAVFELLGDAGAQEGRVAAVVTTCTYDVMGRTAVRLARPWGLPVVHLSHACQAAVPEEAWYAAETPGDYVLVQGERDAEWWRRCVATTGSRTNIIITGHPLWDEHAGKRATPTDPPTVVWAAESGANPCQTPRYWRSRDVPERAWQTFLGALRQMKRPLRVVLKVRLGEDGALIQRWMREMGEALEGSGHRLIVSQQRPAEVLPEASVVVCQDSNFGVEALMYGVEVISLTRDGSDLFAQDGGVCVLDAHHSCFGMDLWAALDAALSRTGEAPYHAVLREEATYYNRGIDGQATARVVEAIGAIAAGRPIERKERQEVAA